MVRSNDIYFLTTQQEMNQLGCPHPVCGFPPTIQQVNPRVQAYLPLLKLQCDGVPNSEDINRPEKYVS